MLPVKSFSWVIAKFIHCSNQPQLVLIIKAALLFFLTTHLHSSTQILLSTVSKFLLLKSCPWESSPSQVPCMNVHEYSMPPWYSLKFKSHNFIVSWKITYFVNYMPLDYRKQSSGSQFGVYAQKDTLFCPLLFLLSVLQPLF